MTSVELGHKFYLGYIFIHSFLTVKVPKGTVPVMVKRTYYCLRDRDGIVSSLP